MAKTTKQKKNTTSKTKVKSAPVGTCDQGYSWDGTKCVKDVG